MDKKEIQERLTQIEDGLRELASECDSAAEVLAYIQAHDDHTGRLIGDVITNLDYAAGFPGENPLRDKVSALEEIRDEVFA
jgi:hypothetical protein